VFVDQSYADFPAMLSPRLRLAAVNVLIVLILGAIFLEALPQRLDPSPPLCLLIQPITRRMGLDQKWNMFSSPDAKNTRIRAEITYRDGETREWRTPDYRKVSPWKRFLGHRRSEWVDNSWGEDDRPIWPGWARYLARAARPEFPEADRGATVRMIADDVYITIPELESWTTWREPPEFNESRTLTIRKLP
jgi:hypothetical protein